MSLRSYKVVLEGDGGRRDVRVVSPTDVQAGDAAAPLMRPGEAIVSIEEADDAQPLSPDAPPPKSQAAEFAPITPGAAAVPER